MSAFLDRTCDLCIWVYLLTICCFMFYCGFWLPIEINRHRLGHSQLDAVQIYNTTLNWAQFHVETEGITIITYKQQKPYDYAYYVGLFTVDNMTNNSNYTNHTMATIELIELSWKQFSSYIQYEQSLPENDLHVQIASYSQTLCPNFTDCIEDYVASTNDSWESEYIFTKITSTHYFNINSESVSITLDNPRDCMILLIMLIAAICYFLIMDGLHIWPKRFKELSIATVAFTTYFLWIFCLSVIPIFRALPYDHNYEYFGNMQHVIIFYIGDWKPGATLWIFGVILSGIWGYLLFLCCPIGSFLFKIIRCVFIGFNDKELVQKTMKMVQQPFQIGALLIVCLISICFFCIFIGYLALWNPNTYRNVNSESVQSIFGVINMCIVIPISACVMVKIPNHQTRMYEENTHAIYQDIDHESDSGTSEIIISNKPTQIEAVAMEPLTDVKCDIMLKRNSI